MVATGECERRRTCRLVKGCTMPVSKKPVKNGFGGGDGAREDRYGWAQRKK